jgi:hypothetical protein
MHMPTKSTRSMLWLPVAGALLATATALQAGPGDESFVGVSLTSAPVASTSSEVGSGDASVETPPPTPTPPPTTTPEPTPTTPPPDSDTCSNPEYDNTISPEADDEYADADFGFEEDCGE